MTNNPNNYLGATASIVGYASGDARFPAYDKTGEKGILEVSIPVNEGYKKDGEWTQTGTTWYVYSGAGEFAENVLSSIRKGDKIRIDDAKQEVREFTNKDGEAKLGITLRFGEFQVLETADQEADF